MKLRDRIRFYQQLAVLMRAGVSLRATLAKMRERYPGRQVAVIEQKVNEGERLADAFKAAGFSDFECHLVAAAERSSYFEVVFQHLADYWDRQREMGRAIVRSVYYPVAVLHFALIVGLVVDLVAIPWPQAVINLIWRVAIFYAVGIVTYVLAKATWTSEGMQRFWLAVPLIGGALSATFAFRWVTALRIEFTAGISLPNAVADAWRASGYSGSEELAEEGQEEMRRGTQLSALVQRWRQLPRDWVDFIETGEVSGKIEEALVQLESEAGRTWKQAQQQLTTWLPRLFYFLVLLIAAAQVFTLAYRLIVTPMTEVQNALDQALK